MLKKSHFFMSLLILCVSFSSAFAASAAREDNSMFLVYLFLGLCGLILFFQLVPVLVLSLGFFKGIFGKREQQKQH